MRIESKSYTAEQVLAACPGHPLLEPVPPSSPVEPDQVRAIIDGLVSGREEQNYGRHGRNVTPIVVPWTPAEVHTALGYPVPNGPHPPPQRVLYRGYAIEAAPRP